jgi:glycosyltransferase involved in cell wall biosynthesis
MVGTTTKVIHVALDPVTGPWSVMRELALAQLRSGKYAEVALGVVASGEWGEAYRAEARGLPVRVFTAATPDGIGTVKFLRQRVQGPPIGQWIEAMGGVGVERVVCHFHNAWMSGVFLPLPEVAGVETRAVVTVHGVNESFEGKPVRRMLHRWMAQRLVRYGASLTSVDAGNLERAERVLRLPRERFAVVANGVEPGLEGPRWTGEGELVLGHLGSMTEQKGWRMAAEAVQRVASTGRRVRLLMAGEGPDDEEARVVAAASGGVVEFVGRVARPREEFLPRIHGLVVMSRQEGLPMSMIETMAQGTPVVATAVGGIPDALAGGRAGMLVARTVDALAGTVERLYDEPAKWRRVAEGAGAVFAERFAISGIVAEYDEVYEKAFL